VLVTKNVIGPVPALAAEDAPPPPCIPVQAERITTVPTAKMARKIDCFIYVSKVDWTDPIKIRRNSSKNHGFAPLRGAYRDVKKEAKKPVFSILSTMPAICMH
jgi:hypothetical protein